MSECNQRACRIPNPDEGGLPTPAFPKPRQAQHDQSELQPNGAAHDFPLPPKDATGFHQEARAKNR